MHMHTRAQSVVCAGKHTGGPGGTSGSGSCTGCNAWGPCSGGSLTISSCKSGYYKSGNSCPKCPSGYTSNNNNTGGASAVCYTSCTKACTRQTCPSNATCTHGSSSTRHNITVVRAVHRLQHVQSAYRVNQDIINLAAVARPVRVSVRQIYHNRVHAIQPARN